MPMPRQSAVLAAHVVTLLFAVAFYALQSEAAGVMLLCASCLFLILSRVDALGLDGFDGAGEAASAFDCARETIVRIGRRQAMLAELLDLPGMAVSANCSERLAWIVRRLALSDPGVETALHDLRDTVALRPGEPQDEEQPASHP
jgi:hypothetical protein